MSHWGIFSQLKKLCFIITILVLSLGFSGINEVTKGFAFVKDKGLNPIPISPNPNTPFNYLRTATTQTYENGLQVNTDGATRYISSNTAPDYNTPDSTLNLYAATKSCTVVSGNIIQQSSNFTIYTNTLQNTQTLALLMYPQVRDVIYRGATITSAILVNESYQNILCDVGVKEITQSWNPTTTLGSLPSTGNQITSSTWDLQSQTISGRTLDVTTIVNNWFTNVNSQWGFMLYNLSEDVPLSLNHPPRLYIDYIMPSGSYSTVVFGGTWYDDKICPGLWIPQRATYINKTGILGNSVETTVYAGFKEDPPFGYDNQSARWVVEGDPLCETGCTAAKINMQTTSENTFNDVKRVLPNKKKKPFNDDQDRPAPPSVTIIADPCCLLPEEQEDACYMNYGSDSVMSTLGNDADRPPNGPVDLNGDCIDDDESMEEAIARMQAVLAACTPIQSVDPIDIDPPPIKPPTPPKPPNPPTPNGSTTYHWQNMAKQIVRFKPTASTAITQLDTSQTGWFDKWRVVGSTLRIAPEGNTLSPFGNQWANDCCDHLRDPRHNKWRFVRIKAEPVGSGGNSNLEDG